ncbi:MAG: FAD-dependent oxidoreductase [Pseudomonadota bacterium]
MTKVLIVGAGPSGLTTAIELARRGVVATLIDKRDQASALSRAVGITPASLRLLSKSGVADKLIAEGVAMNAMHIYQGSRLTLSAPLHSDRTYFPTILALAQDRTENLMVDTLQSLGGSVHYGKSLTTLSDRGNVVTTRFEDNSEDEYELVIGADGVHSTVRQQAGIPFPGFDLSETWSIADVDIKDWRHPGGFTLISAAPGVVIVVAPLGKTRYRVIGSHVNALQALPLPAEVINLRREGTFNIAIRQAKSYSQGRIHLVGDAAHCHSPVGGRGMNIGIADAAELARRIVEGSIDGYSEQRHKEGKTVINATERGRKLIAGVRWPQRLAFRSLLAGAGLSKSIKRRLGQFVVEV